MGFRKKRKGNKKNRKGGYKKEEGFMKRWILLVRTKPCGAQCNMARHPSLVISKISFLVGNPALNRFLYLLYIIVASTKW